MLVLKFLGIPRAFFQQNHPLPISDMPSFIRAGAIFKIGQWKRLGCKAKEIATFFHPEQSNLPSHTSSKEASSTVYLEGQRDLVSRFLRGISRVTVCEETLMLVWRCQLASAVQL